MSPPKLKPFNDPRVTLRSAHLNGRHYGYIHSAPTSLPHRGTIVLIHGFPDISFGWRYQIPFLSSLGLEVIAPDCLGYGRSDSPPTSSLSSYTCRRIADDIASLCQQLNLSSIILGGHDWGGMIVYRIALFYPDLVKAFFSVCTPYSPPTPIHTPLSTLVATAAPSFNYQLQFASGEVESHIQSPNEIRQFLSALYGGKTPDKKQAFDAEHGGVNFSLLPGISKSRLLDDDEMDFYVQEYSRHGINGPLNWYRVREHNYVDDLDFFFDTSSSNNNNKTPKLKSTFAADDGGALKIVDKEVLFIQAMKDDALRPYLAKKMDRRIEKLSWKEVQAGHWALWERPEEVNGFIGRWLEEKVFDKEKETGKSKL